MLHNNSPRMGVPLKSQTGPLVGPTTYIICDKDDFVNSVPFLSTEEKKPSFIRPVVCDTFYDSRVPTTIPGGSSPRDRSPRFRGDTDCPTPGPGYYEVEPKELLRKGNGKLYLCPVPLSWEENKPKRRKRPVANVGPLTYDTGKEITYGYYYKGFKWSASRTQRKFFNATDTPGPAAYDVKPSKCPRGQRDEEFRSLARLLSYVPRFLDAQEIKLKKECLPGPGQYDIGKLETCKICPGIYSKPFISRSPRWRSKKEDCTPPPGTYELRGHPSYPVSKIGAPFSILSARFPIEEEESLPGPGHYNIKGSVRQFLEEKKNCYVDVEPPFATTGRRDTLAISKYTLSIPSPANYTVDSEKRCKVPIYSPFKSKTKRFPRGKCGFEFTHDTVEAFRATRNQKFFNVYEVPFNTSAKRKSFIDKLNLSVPPPGLYSPESKFCCEVKAITIPKTKRWGDVDNGIPGPGTYTLNPLYDRAIHKTFTTHNLMLKEEILKKKLRKHPRETWKKWYTSLKRPKKMACFINKDKDGTKFDINE